MTKTTDGGPAFPCPHESAPNEGMSLRDWFAGMALSGWIASVTVPPDANRAAEACYQYADAMLAERIK